MIEPKKMLTSWGGLNTNQKEALSTNGGNHVTVLKYQKNHSRTCAIIFFFLH